MNREMARYAFEEIETDIINGYLTKEDLEWIIKKLQALVNSGKVEILIAEGEEDERGIGEAKG